MKSTILLIFLTLLSCNKTDYSGSWISFGDRFENTLVLEKIEGKENTYKFSFDGWRNSYDSFAGQIIKFKGGMTEEFFRIEIKENKAYYSDDGLVLDEEFPLYNQGEERCKVYFTFNKDSITVQTKDCHLIYGGFGVAFDGIYKKK